MAADLFVTGKDFKEGGWIPNRYSGYGDDISPELRIEGIDENAVSMVITLDDMDHPLFPGFNHWIAWNLPPVPVIPEALPKGAVVEQPIHMEQGIAYGRHCYRGPKPPFHWNHKYCFTVYVLDVILSVDANSGKQAVRKAMENHVIQKGTLTAQYQRQHP